MKSKQQLIKEIEQNTGREHRVIIHVIVDDIFAEFKDRADFYKRYRYNPADFMDEQPEDYKIWQKHYKKKVRPNKLKPIGFWFEVWLFDYCFKDVNI